jgi:hypothetical protein
MEFGPRPETTRFWKPLKVESVTFCTLMVCPRLNPKLRGFPATIAVTLPAEADIEMMFRELYICTGFPGADGKRIQAFSIHPKSGRFT